MQNPKHTTYVRLEYADGSTQTLRDQAAQAWTKDVDSRVVMASLRGDPMPAHQWERTAQRVYLVLTVVCGDDGTRTYRIPAPQMQAALLQDLRAHQQAYNGEVHTAEAMAVERMLDTLREQYAACTVERRLGEPLRRADDAIEDVFVLYLQA